jgi:hypothetical protein
MAVKITSILTRPSTNIPWPSTTLFGGDTDRDGIRSREGFLDMTKEISTDGLTMRVVELWKDGFPDASKLSAEQKVMVEKFKKYHADNNITSSNTVEQI